MGPIINLKITGFTFNDGNVFSGKIPYHFMKCYGAALEGR